MKTFEKKSSKVKQLGVKTIFYDNNKIFAMNGFEKHPQVLFDAEFANINTLNSVVESPKNLKVLDFKPYQPGFIISRKLQDKEQLETKINKIKHISYEQKAFGLNTKNNLESQIFSNFKDIKIQIAANINNVLFAINSRFNEKTGKLFDFVGTLPVEVPRIEFDWDRKNLTQDDEKNILQATKKVLEERSIYINDQSEDKSFDFLKLLAMLRQFCVHAEEYDFSALNLKNLINIAKKDVANFEKSFVETNEKYFNILKCLLKYDENFKNLFPMRRESLFQQFFDFFVYDEAKNYGFSFNTIRKKLFEIIEEQQKLEQEKTKQEKTEKLGWEKDLQKIAKYLNNINPSIKGEYFNILKNLINFYIWKYFTHSGLDQKIMRLHQTENLIEKQQLYQEWLFDAIENGNFLKTILNMFPSILNFCGGHKRSVDFNPKFRKPCQHDMLNALYVFSKFLTDAEANQFYSNIIDKFESIKDILFLVDKEHIKISDKVINQVKPLFRFESIDEDIKTLKVFQNLRKRKKATSDKELKADWESIYKAFRTNIPKKQFKKQAERQQSSKNSKIINPLMKYLVNDVFKSKEYQYIYHYATPRICQEIIKQPFLVKFAIYNMLGANPNGKIEFDKQFASAHKYLLRIYYDFKTKEGYDGTEKQIDEDKLNELLNGLQELTLEKINECIFNTENLPNYKVLSKLYFKVCYLVTRMLNQINASYMIAFLDYEAYYRELNPKSKAKYDLTIVKHYLEHSRNKKSRSYKQLETLLNRNYAKKFWKNAKLDKDYSTAVKKYRDAVCHGNLLADANIFADIQLENITSYFALYQTLMQKYLKNQTWIKANSEFYKIKPHKQYSTKLCIALNFLFAYSISRFNNLTIEKYSKFGVDKKKKV